MGEGAEAGPAAAGTGTQVGVGAGAEAEAGAERKTDAGSWHLGTCSGTPGRLAVGSSVVAAGAQALAQEADIIVLLLLIWVRRLDVTEADSCCQPLPDPVTVPTWTWT
jgi:hypothetical protein